MLVVAIKPNGRARCFAPEGAIDWPEISQATEAFARASEDLDDALSLAKEKHSRDNV